MTPLHTAYTYSVMPSDNGVVITIFEKLRIVSDHPFLVFGELIVDFRRVTFYLASSNTLERVHSFMDSLTDDQIYRQWFKTKVHKQPKNKS